MRLFILLLLMASIASADSLFYNGYETNETQLGLMNSDFFLNGFLVKSTLTDTQPISLNGTTPTFSGQIGYLRMIIIPSSPVIPPINGTNGTTGNIIFRSRFFHSIIFITKVRR